MHADEGQPSITGITSAGTLAVGTKGVADWLIIPYSSAAPTVDVQYRVGGTLYYTVGGESITVPLYPDTITVKPDPRLYVDYFLEKYVYADDPRTSGEYSRFQSLLFTQVYLSGKTKINK